MHQESQQELGTYGCSWDGLHAACPWSVEAAAGSKKGRSGYLKEASSNEDRGQSYKSSTLDTTAKSRNRYT